jgi:hypothetical protein
MEVTMTTVKSLAIVALLVGGTSLAIAQSGLPTGGEPPVGGGAAGNPVNTGPPPPGVIPHDVRGPGLQSTAPSPYLQSAAPPTGAATTTRLAHQPTSRTHRHMYMSARSPHHKTLKTGQQLPKQPLKQ